MDIKSYFAKTDQGPYFNINEDGIDIDLTMKVFMLFDGFGGSGIGDETVKILKQSIRSFLTRVGRDPNATLPFYFSPKYLLEANALINSMHYAHSLIKKNNKNKSLGERGGASAVLAVVSDHVLTSISVGNCFSYLVRHGKIFNINAPDCLNSILDDFSQNSLYTAPLSGFGLFEDLHLQVKETKIQKGDTFLMFSDGVAANIGPDDIQYILGQGELAQKEKMIGLFELANSRGNRDNQSGILVKF